MGKPAAKKGDLIQATDIHNVIMPNGAVTPQTCSFMGKIKDGCIDSVLINGKPAAVKGSKGRNLATHVPYPPATSFQNPPQNEGEITMGSQTVLIGGKPAARSDDMAKTCTDVQGPPAKVKVLGLGDVEIGG